MTIRWVPAGTPLMWNEVIFLAERVLIARPLSETYGYADKANPKRSLGGFAVKNGAIVQGKVRAGTVKLSIASNNTIGDFVDGSPFIIDIPASRSKVTVHTGKTTDIGTIEVQLKR
jgi:hypothetical protein